MIVIFVNDVAVMCITCPSYFILYYFYESLSSERTEVSFCEYNAFNKQMTIYNIIYIKKT